MRTETTEFLIFEEYQFTGKTSKFFVSNKKLQYQLGTIEWYGPWRKYCFYTSGHSIFDSKCLNDIVAFIQKLMDERKVKKC